MTVLGPAAQGCVVGPAACAVLYRLRLLIRDTGGHVARQREHPATE